jgi:hypothetical protein
MASLDIIPYEILSASYSRRHRTNPQHSPQPLHLTAAEKADKVFFRYIFDIYKEK